MSSVLICEYHYFHSLAHRLSLDGAKAAGGFGEPRVPEPTPAEVGTVGAAESASAGGRSLLQGVDTNNFDCVGCPAGGPDTRTSVADTSSFPYSAIGQLMGQVTSNTCAPHPLILPRSTNFLLQPVHLAPCNSQCRPVVCSCGGSPRSQKLPAAFLLEATAGSASWQVL